MLSATLDWFCARIDYTGSTSYGSFDNLNLQVWSQIVRHSPDPHRPIHQPIQHIRGTLFPHSQRRPISDARGVAE